MKHLKYSWLETLMKPKNYMLVLIVGSALILVGAFVFLKPKTAHQTAPPTATTTDGEASTPANVNGNSKSFELLITGKKLVSGPETLKVAEGDNVVIKITSNEDDEFHLHGYDKSVELAKGKPAEIVFVANLSGRFVYELEKSKTDIGALEVSPK